MAGSLSEESWELSFRPWVACVRTGPQVSNYLVLKICQFSHYSILFPVLEFKRPMHKDLEVLVHCCIFSVVLEAFTQRP